MTIDQTMSQALDVLMKTELADVLELEDDFDLVDESSGMKMAHQ